MKITKSKLLEMIKEEIKSLDEAFGQNVFQRVLGFKSKEADEVMKKANKIINNVEYVLRGESGIFDGEAYGLYAYPDNRPHPLAADESMHGYAPPGFSRQVKQLRQLRDKEQLAKGRKVADRYRQASINLGKAIEQAGDANDAARAAEEKRLAKSWARRDPEEAGDESKGEPFRMPGSTRSSGSRKYNRDFGREYTRGSDLDWDEDISRLEETSKSKLKRIIREELKNRIQEEK